MKQYCEVCKQDNGRTECLTRLQTYQPIIGVYVCVSGGECIKASDYNILQVENEQLKKELEIFRKSERELSNAYMRIRELVGAWNTKSGGLDRFEVTENKIRELKKELEAARLKMVD